MDPKEAARLYYTRLLEVTTDPVLLTRTIEICSTDEGFHDIAREAAVLRWRNGWRPKSRYRKGRHHWGDSDMRPAGQVWFHGDTWWTFTRWSASRVERRFDQRSNPLDHELVPVYVDPPPWQRRHCGWREIEY